MKPPVRLQFRVRDFARSGGVSWQGTHTKAKTSLTELHELLEAGALHIKWNGMRVFFHFLYIFIVAHGFLIFSDPMLIVDSDGFIIAVLLGRPEDPDWDDVIADVIELLKSVREDGIAWGIFKKDDFKHRRGDSFVPVSFGVSLGGGQQVFRFQKIFSSR
jgi:hypothetical protein